MLVADNSAAGSLPIRIRLTFNVTGNGSDVTMMSATLELERNDRVKPTAPVVTGDGDGAVVRSDLEYPNVSKIEQTEGRISRDQFPSP